MGVHSHTERDVADAQSIPGSVASRLRDGREHSGMSLRALARTIGVSASLISQIENGKTNPSVGTLYAIASELGISLDELFSNPGAAASDAPSPQHEHGPVLRAVDRPTVDLAGGVRWERLTRATDPDVDFLLVTYAVGGASCPAGALMRHGGHECGVVLSGRLGATIGAVAYELGPGDAIASDSTVPHRFWTIGDEPVTAVWIVVGRTADPHRRHP
jgi:transcriptional regulator with XRE-family HTH domain